MKKTKELEKYVKDKNINGLWKKFKQLIFIGYDCFELEDETPYIITRVKEK